MSFGSSDDPDRDRRGTLECPACAQPSATPFMRHEYLRALHASGAPPTTPAGRRSSCSSNGATNSSPPARCTSRSIRTANTCSTGPGPTPTNGMACATTRSCCRAVPFTPVPGSRLLARDDAARELLLEAISQIARDAKLSSAHVLFLDDATRRRARRRLDAAQHCAVPLDQPPALALRDFADFLATLQRDKRKKIQQERRRVAEAGITFASCVARDRRARLGLLPSLLHPHLPGASLHALPDARLLPPHRQDDGEHWLLFIAREASAIAPSLIAIDCARDAPTAATGAPSSRPLPALRGVLLPAARLVHRPRRASLRRRRARRAQDGARPAAGADLVRALARTPAVRGQRSPISSSAKAPASRTTWTS